MPLKRWFAVGWLARRLVGELRGIKEGLDTQNQLLTRLADRIAPQPPAPEAGKAAEGSVDFLDPGELDAVASYITRMRRDLGRDPTEDEVLIHLAERDTASLQSRLDERTALLKEMGRL